MQSKSHKKLVGVATMLVATVIMVAVPKTTQAATQEVGVLQQVYGFGNWTSVGFGVLGAVVCSVATGGAGTLACGIGATI